MPAAGNLWDPSSPSTTSLPRYRASPVRRTRHRCVKVPDGGKSPRRLRDRPPPLLCHIVLVSSAVLVLCVVVVAVFVVLFLVSSSSSAASSSAASVVVQHTRSHVAYRFVSATAPPSSAPPTYAPPFSAPPSGAPPVTMSSAPVLACGCHAMTLRRNSGSGSGTALAQGVRRTMGLSGQRCDGQWQATFLPMLVPTGHTPSHLVISASRPIHRFAPLADMPLQKCCQKVSDFLPLLYRCSATFCRTLPLCFLRSKQERDRRRRRASAAEKAPV